MDDLDQLLDEVEKKFCRDVSVAASSHADVNKAGKLEKDDDGKKKRSAAKPDHLTSSDAEDIDAFLDELLEEDHNKSQPTTDCHHKCPQAEKKASFQPGGKKCCPVYLGGSSVTNGLGTTMSKSRSCDQLRCTSCDFWVLLFDDCEWDSSCDYLFFRNNVPDHQKLKAKLKRRRGSRSYACQCSWFSARETTDLRDHHQLRWVCGKHQD
ncbi:hypothetical protein LDENG_00169660 [Lucifuga dentata]|nr:hypothetical protein LDENG_00169660 [Lucifuga dentata]